LFLGRHMAEPIWSPHLEEAIGQLWVMQYELKALQSLATQIRDLVLERSDETPSLVVALSSTTKQIEGCVDAANTNMVHWGVRQALIAVFSHFPKLELELELLGSVYNADLTKDEMEALWTQTCRAPKIYNGEHMFRLVKDLKVVLRKGKGGGSKKMKKVEKNAEKNAVTKLHDCSKKDQYFRIYRIRRT
jgi:hypothetical protein